MGGIPAPIHLLTKVQISNLREILRIENHSSCRKLVQSTAALAHAWKSRTRPIRRNVHGLLILPLSPAEIQDAETLLYRISQLDLENNESLAKLVPFEDKTTGLLVTSGRLGSDMGSTFKVPIIPAGHVAKLLALQCHQRGHGGHNNGEITEPCMGITRQKNCEGSCL